MAGNTFGTLFKLTTFGESHGTVIGAVIDGCPAGLKLDFDFIQACMDRRKPGMSNLSSSRKESDKVEIISGIYENITTGSPIGILIKNIDSKPKDYDHLKDVFRPSHADYTYQKKYGIRDHRGGGRASARETSLRVAAGAIAQLLLSKVAGVKISAYVSGIGSVQMKNSNQLHSKTEIEKSPVRCPDATASTEMVGLIENAKAEKDSLGGIVSCVIYPCPAGLGEPVYDRFEADLAKAMLSINATKGFEIGSGFLSAQMKGSEHNDAIESNKDADVSFKSNHAGGVLGGITTAEPVCFNVAFKPVATIGKAQESINTSGENISLEAKGRHDPCVVPRAVPIVEAMAALVTADHFLRSQISKI